MRLMFTVETLPPRPRLKSELLPTLSVHTRSIHRLVRPPPERVCDSSVGPPSLTLSVPCLAAPLSHPHTKFQVHSSSPSHQALKLYHFLALGRDIVLA